MERLRYYILSAIVLMIHFKAAASHIYGGDLLYKSINDTFYSVSLTIYGDCAGASFVQLATAHPVIQIKHGTQVTNLQLEKEPGSGNDVTPVCPAEVGNTACRNLTNPTLPGIAKYVYTAIAKIPTRYNDWVFIFAGSTNPGSAGRTNAISNIYVNNGSLMYLEAHLNNMDGPNSSPVYTSIPTPFFCINKQQEYNQGAIDPNKDSLSFLLTPALETSTTTVRYVPPYRGEAPLSTAAGAFNYDNVNGQMSFTPDMAQVSLVANKIEEYKNGVLVGSSMREMTFIVLPNCSNSPPVGKIDPRVAGGAVAPGNLVNVCQGSEKLEFTINPTDANNDKISITSSEIPFGGIVTIINNNTLKPTILFTWDSIKDKPLGIYTFFLTYKDDGCPLSSNQTVAYTIKIVKGIDVKHKIITPTQCAHNAFVEFTMKGGIKPKILVISMGDKVIKEYTDSLNTNDTLYTVADSFKKGVYDVVLFSPYLGCSTQYRMIIPDSGVYPYPPVYDHIHTCLNDTVRPILLKVDTTSFYINWYDAQNNKLPATPTYTTDGVMVYNWQISQTHNTCESEKVDFRVYVHPPPEAVILNRPAKVCLGDEIYLLASGGETYTWLPAEKIYNNRQGQIYTTVMAPTTYSVIVYSQYGCKDTADISYTDIENCCTFSYPTAFTPNGDGKNDKFKALFYGNASQYMFSVFNRWGQQVFTTSYAFEGWDGTFKGKPCDAGVYFYRVKAKCLTGKEENSSGDLMLIR